MSRLTWWQSRRTNQMLAAADARDLYYDPADILRHRSGGSPESDLAVHMRDAEIVADLITTGRLRRDETGGVVPTPITTRSDT